MVSLGFIFLYINNEPLTPNDRTTPMILARTTLPLVRPYVRVESPAELTGNSGRSNRTHEGSHVILPFYLICLHGLKVFGR